MGAFVRGVGEAGGGMSVVGVGSLTVLLRVCVCVGGGCLHFPNIHAFMHRAMSTYVMSSLECEATDTFTVSRHIALRDMDAR